MKLTKEQAIKRAINKINLLGDTCDIYEILYSYKALRDLSEEEIDEIYNYIVEILGF